MTVRASFVRLTSPFSEVHSPLLTEAGEGRCLGRFPVPSPRDKDTKRSSEPCSSPLTTRHFFPRFSSCLLKFLSLFVSFVDFM